MKIFHHDQHAKIWADDHAPYIFSIFYSVPETLEHFDSVMLSELHAIQKIGARKQGGTYSICDISNLSNAQVELLCENAHEQIARQFKTGLTYKSFVVTNEFLSSIPCTKLMNMNLEFPVSMFGSFDKALRFANKLWLAPANIS